MANDSIVSQIDAEILKLSQARYLVAATGKAAKAVERITKKTSKAKKAAPVTKAAKAKKRRRLSPEARERIAEAQRKRWAAQKSAKA
ncbi:MAG: hypothetical protein ABSC48_12100 [Terracidiphilus sp.]|jgi:hypothetical protein